jgi:magnesium transporter
MQQLYVTHCFYDEGLSREAGFGVRAGSTRDPLALRFALEFPQYELPSGVEAGDGAPRRLALVRVPGGRTALIHSAPLPCDDRGRANNFFSHIVFADGLSACDALSAWAAPGWAVDCPPGSDKELPPPAGLPRGRSVGDRALTAFLREPAHPADPSLATLTCPARLAEDRARRRRLAALVLRGCLLALRAGTAASRGRFYLLAEPGLVALLLYGAARLLPRALIGDLTFSTYEHALSGLRSFRHARVVGTWLADPARGLDEEYFTERGYALDTFNDRHSPELGADTDAALEEWLELAARGEWATIDRMHALIGTTATSLVAYKDGVRAARLARRVKAGRADADDLLALKRSPVGSSVLAEHRERLWPVVRDGSLADPRLREEFAELIRENLPDLERRAAALLRERPPGSWQPFWRVIGSVLKDDPARLREALERVLPEPPYSPALCLAVLAELQSQQPPAAETRVPPHALLKNFGATDLEQFAHASLPREWFVWALCYAVLRPETRDSAARFLHEGDDGLVHLFWQQFRLLRDDAQRRAILSALVATAGVRGPSFLGRLLASGCPLRPDTLFWLLEQLGAWAPEWADFWGRDDYFGRLLERVRTFGDEGGPVWDRLCGAIDRRVLPPGDPYQHALLMSLAAVAARPGPPLPRPAAEAITDWSLLRDHFEKASALAPEARPAVIAACNRRRLDPVAELSGYFTRFVRPQPVRDELLDDFAGFFHSFYAEPREYPDHGARLLGWLQVVGDCPDPAKKAAYQRYYLHRFVPDEFRRRLADEAHRAGKLLPTVYETVDRPEQPVSEAEASAPATGGGDELHQLTGVRLGTGETALPLLALWRRLPGLVAALAAGVGGVLLFGLYQPPTKAPPLPVLVSFVPLVLFVADAVALQSAGLAVRLRAGPLRAVGRELIAAVVLAVSCGGVSGGAALVLGAPQRLGLAVGAGAAAGAAVAAFAGLALPLLLGRVRGGERLAAGPPARALAGAAALALYFLLIRACGA